VVNEVSGQDLTWFFDEVHRSANVFDYGVQEVSTRPAGGRGYFGDGRERTFVSSPARHDTFVTTVVVRRYGEAIFPVDLRVRFENGEQVTEHWDGRDRWALFQYERPARGVSAVVDPERVLLLDVNYTNNSYTLQPKARQAARKWALQWLVWLQDLLLTYAFFV